MINGIFLFLYKSILRDQRNPRAKNISINQTILFASLHYKNFNHGNSNWRQVSDFFS